MKPYDAKNPLTVSQLASYDLTDKGRFEESLAVLAALKAAQSRFRAHIIRFHRDEYKLVALDDLHRCGQWIFFKNHPEAGLRSFAGGFMCKDHLHCPPCAFRRAYVAAVLSARRISELIARRGLVPAFVRHSADPGPDFAERFRHLKKAYRKSVRMRPAVSPSVKGSVGCFEFRHQEGLWLLSVNELALTRGKACLAPQDVFKAVFEVFLGSVLLLPPERHFEALQALQGTYPFLFEGCLSSLAHSFGNDSSDPPDALLAGEDFFEEQCKWDKTRNLYEFVHLNSGSDMRFPFAAAKKVQRDFCPDWHSRRDSFLRSLRREALEA